MPKCAFGQSQVGSTLWQIRMPSDATVLPSASGVLLMANASISGDGVISVTIHLTERINLIRSLFNQWIGLYWFILVYIREHWQEAMFFPMKHGSCSCCSLLFSDIDHPEDVPGCDGLKRKPLIFPLPKDKDLRILLSTVNFPPIYIYNSIYSNSIWVIKIIKPKQTQLHLTICPIHKLPFGIFAGLTQISFFFKNHFRSLGFF